MIQVFRSLRIILRQIVRQVNKPIGFDDEAAFMTIEVNDVRTNRMLSSKFAAHLFPVSQMPP